MTTPVDPDVQTYARGYEVGYKHGLEAARGGGDGSDPIIPGEYPVTVLARRPENSSRWLMFFWFIRPFLLIPHLFVLWFLGVGAFFCLIAAWFVVVFTGEYPATLHKFQVSVLRWTTRVNAYVLCLTDQYPPFSLD